MKKLLISAALVAGTIPAFAGSMHGSDWANVIGAALAPPPVVVVAPQPVYVAPVYQRPRLIDYRFLPNGFRACIYDNGQQIIITGQPGDAVCPG
jgi:hypothetical protein